MQLSDECIKSMQNIELNMLKCFISICEKHNFQYFLGGGTLLGAIRHKGFIPWDDDIDIYMLRKDYDAFLKISINEFPEYYFLQNFHTDDVPFNFSKIRDSRTTFIEFSCKDIKMNHGIFIDIFPLDNYKKDTGLIEILNKAKNGFAYYKILENLNIDRGKQD